MSRWSPLFGRVAARYRNADRFSRAYVPRKLRQDPVHADVLDLASREQFGDVLDLGCGRGQLGIALLESGLAVSVLGLDREGPHLRAAREAGVGLPFRAVDQDLASGAALPEADTVLLVDVLYQLDAAVQSALLRTALRAARHRIVIRTADPGLGWRSVLTRSLEKTIRPLWPNSGMQVNAQPMATIVAHVEVAGFVTAIAPCRRGTPFSNVLLTGRRVVPC